MNVFPYIIKQITFTGYSKFHWHRSQSHYAQRVPNFICIGCSYCCWYRWCCCFIFFQTRKPLCFITWKKVGIFNFAFDFNIFFIQKKKKRGSRISSEVSTNTETDFNIDCESIHFSSFRINRENQSSRMSLDTFETFVDSTPPSTQATDNDFTTTSTTTNAQVSNKICCNK